MGSGANVRLRGKFHLREMDFRLTKTEKHCDARRGVQIEKDLYAESPENGNIPQIAWRLSERCRRGSGWNWAWRILREHEGIVSGCEVNRLIARLYGERLPSIDLVHVDLSKGEQRPEQHGCGVC